MKEEHTEVFIDPGQIPGMGWILNFITFDQGKFVAWDETRAYELGRFDSLSDVEECLLDYSKVLCDGNTKELVEQMLEDIS